MLVGVPREVKDHETRIGLTPAGTRELIRAGHGVLIETGAGLGCGLSDEAYAAEGANVVAVDRVWSAAELLVKVKEPEPDEAERLNSSQILFTYLHLAANPDLTDQLVASGATCIAYETVEDEDGRLPLLAPMSEVAGRLAVQMGAGALTNISGGSGLLLGGVPGVKRGKVVILGGGVAGAEAARVAVGLGAETVVLDRSIPRLRELDREFGRDIETLYATSLSLEATIRDAQLVIGAVLITGARAPRLVSRELVQEMQTGSVVVDVSIDQGGCIETSRPTTYSDPTYEVDGVVHCCVTNMPAAVGITSTLALTNATLPYVLRLAELGGGRAAADDATLAAGVNVVGRQIVHPGVRPAAAEAR